jgi:hypothetical protein
MKTAFKLVGIITIMAVIGFSMAACDNGGDDNQGHDNQGQGTFTLTGIPSEYNGKYILFRGYNGEGEVRGFQSAVNTSTGLVNLVPISSGSASIPLWIRWGVRYSGNDTGEASVFIFSQQQITFGDMPVPIDGRYIASGTFSNGSASRTWSQGTTP